MNIPFDCDPMLQVNTATLKSIGVERDEDSDNGSNMRFSIFVVYLFLKSIYVYFDEELISNT